MSWADARAALAQAKVALLPVGSTEQHGPHLPLGTDWMTAQEIAHRAAQAGPWLVLPTVPVGVSEHHRQFWGTLWVSPETLKAYVSELARALASHGLNRVVFVNGHGGNTPALEEAARKLRQENIFAYVYVWWRSIPEVVAEVLSPGGGGHAGEMEASVVWAIAPDLARKERFAEAAAGAASEWGKKVHAVEIGYDTRDFSQSGAVGDPRPAAPEKGEKVLRAAAEKLHEFCAWLATQPEEALRSPPHLP